ncbi:unnamed protein product [Mytilus edulis]|uniref:Endonuclease/exonuclease/phosphatase domain-containing protein n=1 Tax=Mytilus edulis TaxID=6550 RepID=A0A8S3SDP2_MYTED|nr:unnamed protein product [Mytilus edulis]
MKNRHDMTFRKSGGLMVLYKEKLCDHIKFLSSDSNFVIWFEISSSYTKLDAEIVIGSVYIPPENTKYSSPDAFREIETDILKFSTKCKYMCLNGDFNSRTSTDADFIPTDGNDISDILNLPEIAENDTYKFEIYNIPIARNNKDKTKNNYGKLLLDLCKFTNMYIINGRIGENMAGERTSKNAAVVDYFIGSLDFINIISNSKVLDFSCLYSDIHSPIDIDVDINKCTCEYGSVPINSMSGEKIKKWDINKKEDFILNLDREKISELENYLEETKSFPADSNIINKAVENITNIFVTSAKKTFGTLKNKSKNENTPQSTRSQDEKPWFNIDCRIARKNARKYRRKYKLNKSIVNQEYKKRSERQYKNTMNRNIKKYRKNVRNDMKNMKTTNSKEYWKILNGGSRKKQPNISIEKLYDFFKNLNQGNIEEEQELNHEEIERNIENNLLNEMITPDEIIKNIKNLKNNKASGDDLIINEFFNRYRKMWCECQ